jgi:hypothetical protein
MHSDTIRSGLLGQPGHGGRIGLDKPAVGIRFIPVAGLPQGSDVIDVDSE